MLNSVCHLCGCICWSFYLENVPWACLLANDTMLTWLHALGPFAFFNSSSFCLTPLLSSCLHSYLCSSCLPLPARLHASILITCLCTNLKPVWLQHRLLWQFPKVYESFCSLCLASALSPCLSLPLNMKIHLSHCPCYCVLPSRSIWLPRVHFEPCRGSSNLKEFLNMIQCWMMQLVWN